jgi:hypothetical protein
MSTIGSIGRNPFGFKSNLGIKLGYRRTFRGFSVDNVSFHAQLCKISRTHGGGAPKRRPYTMRLAKRLKRPR